MATWKNILIAMVLTGLGLLGVARPAQAQIFRPGVDRPYRWQRAYPPGYGVPNGYYNPTVNVYPNVVPSADPYAGYFSGAANLVNAQGSYLVNAQQANLLKQEAVSAQLSTRRQAFDESLYEQANTPTQNDVRIQEQQQELERALTNPPQTEIWSAKTLNDLLANAEQMQARGIQGPEVPLNTQMLQDVNVSVKQQANVGLLKQSKLQWPLALRKLYPADQVQKLREQIEQSMASAKQQSIKGQVDANLLTNLDQSIQQLTGLLKDQVGSLAFADYTAAKRFMHDLDQAVEVLKQPDVAKFVGGAYAAHGHTVNEMVSYMSQNGLWFSAATSGQEAAYSSLYQALLRYTLSNNGTIAYGP